MNPAHRELAAGRWRTLSLLEQLGNAGSEVDRALNWEKKGRTDFRGKAVDRALELLDLTLADPAHRGRLREIARAREAVADYFYGKNEYGSTAESLSRYFLQFATAARKTVRELL
jgi:hypothetical protein